MTGALVALTGAVFCITAVGAATLHGNVFAVAIPLVAYLFAAVLRRPERPDLILERRFARAAAVQGEPVECSLALINRGAPLDEVAAREKLPEGVEGVSGAFRRLGALPAEGCFRLEQTIRCRRGVYAAFETEVSVRDFAGLFTSVELLASRAPLLVRPAYRALREAPVRPSGTRGFAGTAPTGQDGAGCAFLGVREYRAGDPLRRVNWKKTAKDERTLYSNVFEQERVADIGLVLDARRCMNISSPEDSLFEYSVEAAAALAERFLDDGNRVSLLMFGGCVEWIVPGYGRKHAQRILDALAKIAPGKNYALEGLVNLPIKLFPAQSTIFFISPLGHDDLEPLVRMRANEYAVAAISPDPVKFASNAAGGSTSQAFRLASAERTSLLRGLSGMGIRTADWDVRTPLEGALRKAFRGKPLFSPR